MPRIIDLSTPIVENHFRWPVERRLHKNHTDDDVQATWAGWIMHAFTHMDSPRHVVADGFTTDSIDYVVALPLKLPDSDGAPARVIALEQD